MVDIQASPAEVRSIARDAHIYGYPMVDSYRILHTYFVEKDSPEYKGDWNQLKSTPRVYTPDDKAVQTPNSDTPYSMLGMDLRAEPMVLSIPAIDGNRYFSVQFVDLYTHNFNYLGSRASGNDGGRYLVAGPGWKGEIPEGITEVIRSETNLLLAIYRTQLFDVDDLDNVKEIQSGYKAQPLSQFLGASAAPAAPSVEFMTPLTPETQKSSLQIFNLLNFLLQFCPTHPSEVELMQRFSRIGVGAGKTIQLDALSPEVAAAMQGGIADAWGELAKLKQRVDAGEVTSGDVFGTREQLKNNYLYRMIAAVVGIFGNSKVEAMYPMYTVDAQGTKLDGANHYALRFAPGQLPPVNAFWSVTMYELPASLLVANPLNRYLINSPMLPQLEHDADGGLTLIVQNESPGQDQESNWLPAPTGSFFMAMRLYWPKDEALTGAWSAPPLQRLD